MIAQLPEELQAISRDWAVRHVQRGQVREYNFQGKTWNTAIYKHPVEGAVEINRYGLVGDEQTGGAPDLDRAVCLHGLGHYTFWRGYFRRDIPLGFFGENLTVSGLLDEDVCVGDILRVGSSLLQVTQPRTPCYKQARKLGEPDFVKLLLQTGRIGFLTRVLEPGELQTGDALQLVERPCPQANLIFVNRKRYEPEDRETARELAELVPLAHDWRAKFAEFASRTT